MRPALPLGQSDATEPPGSRPPTSPPRRARTPGGLSGGDRSVEASRRTTWASRETGTASSRGARCSGRAARSPPAWPSPARSRRAPWPRRPSTARVRRSPAIRSPSASPRATPGRTASCSGRAWRPRRWRRPAGCRTSAIPSASSSRSTTSSAASSAATSSGRCPTRPTAPAPRCRDWTRPRSTSTASRRGGRSAPSAAPGPRRSSARRSSRSASPSSPARTSWPATSTPTPTSSPRTSTRSSTSATTSTRAAARIYGRTSRARRSRTLDDYRIRHAQYKTDVDLQAAHAALPWLVTWDDHEVDNNYADLDSDPDTPGRGVHPAPRGRLPRLLGAHAAAAGAQAQGRVLRPVPALPLGDDGDLQRARHAPVPLGPAARVPGGRPRRGRRLLPRRARGRAARCSGGSSASGCSRTSPPPRRAGTCSPSRPALSPWDRHVDPAVIDYGTGDKLGRLPRRARSCCSTGSWPARRRTPSSSPATPTRTGCRNVPPSHLELDAPPVATEFMGTLDLERRRSAGAVHPVPGRPGQPPRRVPQQQPRLRALHADGGHLDERLPDRADGARARGARPRRWRASWWRTAERARSSPARRPSDARRGQAGGGQRRGSRSPRRRTESFAYAWLRCVSTVLRLRKSSAAISRLLRPPAASVDDPPLRGRQRLRAAEPAAARPGAGHRELARGRARRRRRRRSGRRGRAPRAARRALRRGPRPAASATPRSRSARASSTRAPARRRCSTRSRSPSARRPGGPTSATARSASPSAAGAPGPDGTGRAPPRRAARRARRSPRAARARAASERQGSIAGVGVPGLPAARRPAARKSAAASSWRPRASRSAAAGVPDGGQQRGRRDLVREAVGRELGLGLVEPPALHLDPHQRVRGRAARRAPGRAPRRSRARPARRPRPRRASRCAAAPRARPARASA